jgi:CheY-like chemotaxis protein
VSLPTVAAAAGNGEGARGPDEGIPKLRILLVEDHEDTAKAMTWLLRRNGHEVTVAHTVRRAVSEAQKGSFDLLISDIGLPDGSGLDVIDRMPRPLIPAIALTGFGMEQDVARSRAAGFQEHLTKPVDYQKLHAVLTSIAAPRARTGA